MNALATRLFDSLNCAILPDSPAVCRSAVMHDPGSHSALRFFAYPDRGSEKIMLRFRASACPDLLAACELTCRMSTGSPESWPAADDLIRELDIPIEKTGRILLIEDALNDLRRQLKSGPIGQ